MADMHMDERPDPHSGFLRGRRVLVVEDEPMIAAFLHDALETLGCQVVGPVGDVELALPIAQAEPLDAAVLDVKLKGPLVLPVAEALSARRVPFVFVSAYVGLPGLLDDYRDVPQVRKPFKIEDLEQAVLAALTGVGNGHGH